MLPAEPEDRPYRVAVTGLASADFTLAGGTATLPDGPESGAVAAGTIPRGAVLVYEVRLASGATPEVRLRADGP